MSRCPICESFKIVIVVDSGRRAWCTRCGARWVQEGSLQRRVKPGVPPALVSDVG